ncbi:DUF4253 domain-containing protein [Kitasatospora sp. NPDC090091]|uniref:DUF4253 domain-containing protein n=1 Tax=Kitasatospora sp. NPDC090091 TaxID=3364081 RepID=UPI003815A9CC
MDRPRDIVEPCAEEFLPDGVVTDVSGVDPSLLERAVSDDGVPVAGYRVGLDAALGEWRRWFEVRDRSGAYPVITNTGPAGLVAEGRLGGPWGHGGPGPLASALARDPEEVLAELVDSVLRWSIEPYVGSDDDSDHETLEEWLDDLVPERLAPRLRPAVTEPRPGVFRNLEEGAARLRDFWICLFPVGEGYEIPGLFPGLLRTPGWLKYRDRQLLPADHVAVLRSWSARYGTEVCYTGPSCLELAVARPPLDPQGAARVAVEQFAYCDDLVDETVAAGDGQVRSTVWSFWWD